MSDFWFGFLLAFFMLLPVRLLLGQFIIFRWSRRDGFRWVMKWEESP